MAFLVMILSVTLLYLLIYYFLLLVWSNIWSMTTARVVFSSLIYDWCKKWLFDFNIGKTELFCLIGLVTLVLLMWKWMGLSLSKNHILRCGGCWEAGLSFNWDQKKVIDRESRLIPRKIKETIHSLKNPNHINKISYVLPEIWLPHLR